MNQYIVSIHRFIDTQVKPRVHMSNPALYVTPSADGSTTVQFGFPDDNTQAWSIHFKDRTPFCTGTTPITDVSNSSTSTVLSLCSSVQPGDYNYTVTVNASGAVLTAATEDPQVIIGGKGNGPLSGWGGAAIGAGLAALLIGILAYRIIAAKLKAG